MATVTRRIMEKGTEGRLTTTIDEMTDDGSLEAATGETDSRTMEGGSTGAEEEVTGEDRIGGSVLEIILIAYSPTNETTNLNIQHKQLWHRLLLNSGEKLTIFPPAHRFIFTGVYRNLEFALE